MKKFTCFNTETGTNGTLQFNSYKEAESFYADCMIDQAQDQSDPEVVAQLKAWQDSEVLSFYGLEIVLI